MMANRRRSSKYVEETFTEHASLATPVLPPVPVLKPMSSSLAKQGALRPYEPLLYRCDTTSAAYNMGKLKFIKIMQKHPELASGTALFLSEKVDPSLLTLVGERFFVALYSGNKDDSLDSMRYKRFAKTVTKNTFSLSSLPPTQDAAGRK
ncbi:hypothetical protein WA026_017124 [Henosepilachna vigintioctopunctata]|uniref:Uncharacterized protein n=1 Tax=Henosepilachna vigintioctopunctata TaxID=420089 RepID=A0AAW1TW45_9CUCU